MKSRFKTRNLTLQGFLHSLGEKTSIRQLDMTWLASSSCNKECQNIICSESACLDVCWAHTPKHVSGEAPGCSLHTNVIFEAEREFQKCNQT